MANSSDEEISTDDSIDVNPLWRASAFLSDSSSEEEKTESSPVTENDAEPPCVLELTPITDLASEHDNSTNTVETSTASADMETCQRSTEPVNWNPRTTPWMPAMTRSFYGHPASPIPVRNVALRSLLERTKITASASAQEDSTNTTGSGMTSAQSRARRRRLAEQITPPGTPAATRCLFDPSKSFPPLRRPHTPLSQLIKEYNISVPPKDSNKEVEDKEIEVKASEKDPRFVLPGAIKEREEKEDAEIAEASRNTRSFRSKYISELMKRPMTNRNSHTDYRKLYGGVKNKKK